MQRSWLWSLTIFSVVAQGSVPLGGPRQAAGSNTDLFGCLKTNAYYAVNFAAYPADLKVSRERKSLQPWCQDIPHPSLIHIAVDLLDRDVRHKPVILRIVDGQGRILAQTPPTVAKTGVVSTTADLSAIGHYEAVVVVHDDELKVPPETSALHIPLNVGLTESSPNTILARLAVFSLGFGLVLALGLPKLMASKPSPVC
ncbi:MAG: hypothetical protein N3A55_03590 [Methylohalobius sp.]|nr:hypothetical protein [Methylohalobius sp.]